MRMFVTLIATLILAGMMGLWLPFWSLALSAMVVGFVVHPGAWSAFLAGLLAGMLLWGGLAYGAGAANAGILSARVGALFGNLIEDPAKIGVDFLLPIYFLSLVMGFRKRANWAPVVLASGAVSALAYHLIGSPWHVSIGALAGIALAAVVGVPRNHKTVA